MVRAKLGARLIGAAVSYLGICVVVVLYLRFIPLTLSSFDRISMSVYLLITATASAEVAFNYIKTKDPDKYKWTAATAFIGFVLLVSGSWLVDFQNGLMLAFYLLAFVFLGYLAVLLFEPLLSK